MENLSSLSQNDYLVSAFIVGGILLLRWFVIRGIRGDSETLSAEQRRWIRATQNVSFLLVFLAILGIWGTELSDFILSLTAFALALVIAGKEVILCLAGGIYRAIERPFTVGDWIEIGDVRGEVTETDWLATQLTELSDPTDARQEYTGRIITIPNSLFLSAQTSNLNSLRNFVVHQFSVFVEARYCKPDKELLLAEQLVAEEWDTYKDVAMRYWTMMRRRTGIDLREPLPEVQIRTTDMAMISFDIRIYCQTTKAADIETGITRALLKQVTDRIT